MLSCVVGASRTGASMPSSQLWDRFGAYLDGSYAAQGEVVPARLLDSTRVLCEMPRCADHRLGLGLGLGLELELGIRLGLVLTLTLTLNTDAPPTGWVRPR